MAEILLKGTPACAGTAKGKAKIILNKNDFAKMKEGDILVTEHTDPSFVPIMTKAAAIITDLGGTTSHAAIVSREMGIPCIVGTTKGTKILKDNQEIEVDATKGIIYLP